MKGGETHREGRVRKGKDGKRREGKRMGRKGELRPHCYLSKPT